RSFCATLKRARGFPSIGWKLSRATPSVTWEFVRKSDNAYVRTTCKRCIVSACVPPPRITEFGMGRRPVVSGCACWDLAVVSAGRSAVASVGHLAVASVGYFAVLVPGWAAPFVAGRRRRFSRRLFPYFCRCAAGGQRPRHSRLA